MSQTLQKKIIASSNKGNKMRKHDKRSLRALVRKRAKIWNEANKKQKRATDARDKAVWRCLAKCAEYVEMAKLTRPKELRSFLQKAIPHLDARGRSRYAKILGGAASCKPKEMSLRAWVKGNGAVAKFKVDHRR